MKSPRASVRIGARLLPLLLAPLFAPAPVAAQAVVDPLVVGQARLGDTVMTEATVVLHHMDPSGGGPIDSVEVAPDGSFVIRLPSMPTGSPDDLYFAAIRHDGVMYFGNFITAPVDLDSLYLIQAYDTVVAPAGGAPVVLEARSIFFEPAGSQWAITDVLQIVNDTDRTFVPAPGGRVWTYPLPEGASDVSSAEDMTDVIAHEGGDIVVRAALQPGPRMFVVRYFVDSLSVSIPTPGEPEFLDVLVREPAPSMAVEGLVQGQGIQLDNGQTYRQFAGEGVTRPAIRIELAEEVPPPPVEWIAVALALILLGGGLLAFRGAGRATAGAPERTANRQDILLQIARLDEAHGRDESPSKARTREYQSRRAELMSRLRPKG